MYSIDRHYTQPTTEPFNTKIVKNHEKYQTIVLQNGKKVFVERNNLVRGPSFFSSIMQVYKTYSFLDPPPPKVNKNLHFYNLKNEHFNLISNIFTVK